MGERNQLVELNIQVNRERFIKHTVADLLKNLDASTKPVWGMMSAQHMVEHLIYITENVIGDRKIQLITPEDKLPKYKAFLMGTYGFMRNFKFPMLPTDELVPLKYDTYESALRAFELITSRLFKLIDAQDFKSSLHPMYGYLNREETIMFQFKHTSHHLMQFGLI